jgi:hypothetical protein
MSLHAKKSTSIIAFGRFFVRRRLRRFLEVSFLGVLLERHR